MGFRLAPREVAPLSSSAGWSPVFVHFGSGSPPLGEGLKGTMDEFAFAISTVHFRTLGKCIKAISEVQADWATANTPPKRAIRFAQKSSIENKDPVAPWLGGA